MSIIDEHPGPWRFDDDGGFVDANGSRLTGPASLRLILAAPEMLAVLKECCKVLSGEGFDGRLPELKTSVSIIDRIEKGEGTS